MNVYFYFTFLVFYEKSLIVYVNINSKIGINQDVLIYTIENSHHFVFPIFITIINYTLYNFMFINFFFFENKKIRKMW